MLVLAVQDGALLVTVAYGTSQAHAAPKVWEVTLQMDAKTPTTFDLSRIVTLPYRVEYFPRKPRKGAWPAMRKAELVAAIKAARR